MLKLIRTLAITGIAILTIAGVTARAGTTTSTFAVTANVISSCVINSVGALGFGAYDPNAATLT